MKSVLLLVVASAFFACVLAEDLYAVTRSTGSVAQLADTFIEQNYDVRASHSEFILVAGSEISAVNSVKLFCYQPSIFTYAVVVEQKVDFAFTETVFLNLTLADCIVLVRGHYVVGVKHANYEKFVEGLPFNFEIVAVPEATISKSFKQELDHETNELYNGISAKLRAEAPNPLITLLINEVTSANLREYATHLSGESSNITTRQSQSVGAVQAQNFFESEFRKHGFNASTHAYRAGYASNVIGEWKGLNASRLVIISAHYDSRGASSTSTTARAPGANDNGSGSAAILTISKIFASWRPTFQYTVRLVVFSGEEQGLYGSQAYAALLKSQGASVAAVLNADMIGYRRPGEIQQLAFPSGSSTASLNSLLGEIAKEYVPQLTIGTSGACCTDHSSFYSQGFPAASYFERNGNIADPMYHNVGDLVNREGYDLPAQYPAITRAILAGAATIAQIYL